MGTLILLNQKQRFDSSFSFKLIVVIKMKILIKAGADIKFAIIGSNVELL